MNAYLPFVVIGLATGSVYGLAGLGLVLTFKTSGIFNIGYGAIAALIVFLFYWLTAEQNLNWAVAAAICLLVVAPLSGLIIELVARSLEKAAESTRVVATTGFILLVVAIGQLWFPAMAPTLAPFLPQSTIQILGVAVTWQQIITVIIAVVAAFALYWLFRFVRLGTVMRGLVDNPDLVAMSGDNPARVRRSAWVIGMVFAGIAGLMIAPNLPIDGGTLTEAVFAAFGAAAIGYFSNLPLAFVGGLLIGIAGSFVDKYSVLTTWLAGLSPSVPYIILILVLVAMPRSRLADTRLRTSSRSRQYYKAPRNVRAATAVVVVILLAVVPSIQATYIAVWSAALISVILFISLGLLVRQSGQISLGHLAFAAVGAAAFGHFAAMGLPWLVALLLAAVVAVPLGVVLAIPAVRLSGVFLALATLGFGILMEDGFYTRSFMFTASTQGVAEPRPDVVVAGVNLGGDRGFYYVLLLATILVVAAVGALGSGRLGRLLGAMRDSPIGLETLGTTSAVLKVIIFCIAAVLASLAGAFTGMLYHYGVGTYFSSLNSLYLVAIVVIIDIGAPWYALVAAIAYSVLPGYISGGTANSVLQLLFGLGAILAAYTLRNTGLPVRVQRLVDRLGGASSRQRSRGAGVSVADSARTVTAGDTNGSPVSERPAGGLVVTDLSVRFGGIRAVDGVSLQAPTGMLTGLIGPNGAGKTTIFNACSGLNRPSSGRILLDGVDVTKLGPAARARKGVGRTFQRPMLFDSLTVRENVRLGREAPMAGIDPVKQMWGSNSSRRAIAGAAEEALALTGTRQIADVQVGLLPPGQRRLVELARVLAGPFHLYLLDEPSSGLDGRETAEFGRILKRAVQEQEFGILLVEHDMTMVREICDYVYVLDFGKLIFEGHVQELEKSPAVRAAYLGDGDTPAGETREAAALSDPGTAGLVVHGEDLGG